MDTECQKERYSLTLVNGPSDKQAAKDYIANVDVNNDNTISQYLTFSGNNKNNLMTIKLAGVVAVCYCGMDECESPSFWIFGGLMTIQGPEGGRNFIFPTNVVVKFDLKGWGFSPNDKIRIIPATSQCSGRKLSSPLGCSLLAGTDRRMPSSPSLSGQEMSRLKGQAP
ncbi:unnamed protein product [Symbiodinium pilosum]|uniref:Uncharacterized protein n=1 Tax=Symbiodinium pilosum TaxID=2952 RepID=A0A812YDF3_SYMPI|nr:unnamed protein product [Symbiodinium pilosum]